MEGRKVSKIFCLVGIFGLVVGVAALTVGIVLILRSDDGNEATSPPPNVEETPKFIE